MATQANHRTQYGEVPCRSYSPSGFLTLGLCSLLLGLYQAGLNAYPGIVAAGFLYGGLAQAMTGVHEWRHGNAFGAVAFTSCGLFWLSLLPVMVLPEAGIGLPFQPFASIPYLTMWCLFVGLLAHGSGQNQRFVGVIFGALAVLLCLTAAGIAWESNALHQSAVIAGVLTGILSTIRGFSMLSLRISQGRGSSAQALSKAR